MPDPSKPPDASKEIEVIARAESARRRRGLARLALGALIVAALIGALVMLAKRGELGPTVEVAEGEQATIEETNDPQCRAFIAEATALGERFAAQDSLAMEPVLSEDRAEVEAARAQVGAMREELELLRDASLKANLRYTASRQELNAWFEFIDTELRLLDLRGERQLERLDAEARGETYEEPELKSRGQVIGKRKGERAEREPEQKRDDALVAVSDAFYKFRVWHSKAMHPCGAADEGETPWRPEQADAAP